jgi:predicted nucleic acid-binding protein
MNNNIIDSSAWIEYFKGNPSYSFITDLIYNNAICTNDIILAELLPSIIHKKETRLANLLNSIRKKILIIDWQEIINMQALNLRNGNNNIGISDLIITQNSIQNDLRIITRDKHFGIMSNYIPIKMYK